jgi:hypothetical protein
MMSSDPSSFNTAMYVPKPEESNSFMVIELTNNFMVLALESAFSKAPLGIAQFLFHDWPSSKASCCVLV